MILQLSNYSTECEPRRVHVRGRPLLTYETLRAGDGSLSRDDNGPEIARYDTSLGVWFWLEDETQWTDIEVLSTDGVVASQVSV